MMIIPKHSKCINCGSCCGPVPIGKKEATKIQKFVDKNKPSFNKTIDSLSCKFRVNGKCSIYPVRPTLCKLFGVTQGMECINGNSENINGFKYLDLKEFIGLLNDVIKISYIDKKLTLNE